MSFCRAVSSLEALQPSQASCNLLQTRTRPSAKKPPWRARIVDGGKRNGNLSWARGAGNHEQPRHECTKTDARCRDEMMCTCFRSRCSSPAFAGGVCQKAVGPMPQRNQLKQPASDPPPCGGRAARDSTFGFLGNRNIVIGLVHLVVARA